MWKAIASFPTPVSGAGSLSLASKKTTTTSSSSLSSSSFTYIHNRATAAVRIRHRSTLGLYGRGGGVYECHSAATSPGGALNESSWSWRSPFRAAASLLFFSSSCAPSSSSSLHATSNSRQSQQQPHTMTDFYSLSATDAQGKPFPFSQLKGKVVLIVNVASKCGFTPQYKELQQVYEQYKDRGLEVIGFPCNQFASQEPGTEQEIVEFCQRTFGVAFPIMQKVDVNGENEHPVYKWLKSQKSGLLGLALIKWNFEKFLVGRDGQVIERYWSKTKPEDIGKDIEKALDAKPAA